MAIEDHPLYRDKDHRSLDELDDRLGFIRKVYGILSIQLLITAFMCGIPAYNEPARQWIEKSIWVVILSFIILIISMCMLVCSKKMAR